MYILSLPKDLAYAQGHDDLLLTMGCYTLIIGRRSISILLIQLLVFMVALNDLRADFWKKSNLQQTDPGPRVHVPALFPRRCSA